MRRSLLTVLIVAALSGLIGRSERAQGTAQGRADWVRTVDGWESRRVLEPNATSAPAVHPAVLAALQLGASLFFLAAFPASAAVRSAPYAHASRSHDRRAAAQPVAAV